MNSSAAGFGARLRMERERRTITLASIAETTKISLSLLKALERDDVSRWPGGIFRRSFIRAYASAIGLDPDSTVREFLERFPEPTTTLPAAATASDGETTRIARAGSFRVRIVEAGEAFARGCLVSDVGRRWAAAGWDIGSVIALGALLFVALDRFWMSVGVAMIAYHVGSVVLLGNTPGVSFFAEPGSHAEPPARTSTPDRGWFRVFSRSLGL